MDVVVECQCVVTLSSGHVCHGMYSSCVSVSANTSIYQSASAIVFILSVPILRERVSILKVLSVLLTVTGVTLISVFSDHGGGSSNITMSAAAAWQRTADATSSEEEKKHATWLCA